jgi:hypothetical protein
MEQQNLAGWIGLILVGALFFGVTTNWSYGQDERFLLVNCPGGLDDAHRCATSEWNPAEPVFVRANKNLQTVLIYPDGGAVSDARTLKDCSVIDKYNWKCGDEAVEHGRYYRIISTPFFNSYLYEYYSSLTGFPYFLFRIKLKSFAEAMNLDGFLTPAPPAHAESGNAAAALATSPPAGSDVFPTPSPPAAISSGEESSEPLVQPSDSPVAPDQRSAQ